jgi:hypothetical protein
MKLTYIYVKRLPDGLMYLGKTDRNPYEYIGSGVKWIRKIRKYKYKKKDIETWILHETNSEEDLKKFGKYYSKLFDVVNSKNWANLKDEDGIGGSSGLSDKQRLIISKKISESSKNKKKVKCPHCNIIGHISNMKAWHFDNCKKHVEREKIKCPHCLKTGNARNMKRWHFDNCPEFTGIKREGRVFSDQHKLNMKNPKSEAHKESIRLASIGKIYKKIECPHCKKYVGSNNAKRWHFDNCKSK